MTTLANLEARIFDDTKYTISTAVRNIFLASHNFYRHRRFWFNERVGSFSVNAGTVEYTISTVIGARDLAMIDGIRMVQSGSVIVVPTPVPWKKAIKNDRLSTGPVTEYSHHHGVLYFFPSPSVGYGVEVSGVYHITLTNSGSSSNVWTNEAGELLLARSESIFYMNYMHNTEEAMALKAYERELFQELRVQTAQRVLDFNEFEPYILDYMQGRGTRTPFPDQGTRDDFYAVLARAQGQQPQG